MDEVGDSFVVSVGGYTVECTPCGLPATYGALNVHAGLVEEIEIHQAGVCCVRVRRDEDEWPSLVVAQSHSLRGAGFTPGVLLVPETRTLFVGMGERVLIYSLEPLRRVAQDTAEVGFWGWRRCGDVVVMSAELEIAAFDHAGGEKLWTLPVEPPWKYTVTGRMIDIDIMGERRVVVVDVRSGRPTT
jgi:hypothetical protein